MASVSTKDILLDTAEKLFAEKGIKETSLRDITALANVNLASVNYHFGSKDGLINGVIVRRINPLNEERFRLLEELNEIYTEREVPVEKILYALLIPGIRLCFSNPHFLRFAGQIVSDPDQEVYHIFVSQFELVFKRFRDAFKCSLTHLPEHELMWRMHFLIGAMIHTWTNHSGLNCLSGGVCKLNNEEEVANRLIGFCSAGLKAPLVKLI